MRRRKGTSEVEGDGVRRRGVELLEKRGRRGIEKEKEDRQRKGG